MLSKFVKAPEPKPWAGCSVPDSTSGHDARSAEWDSKWGFPTRVLRHGSVVSTPTTVGRRRRTVGETGIAVAVVVAHRVAFLLFDRVKYSSQIRKVKFTH